MTTIDHSNIHPGVLELARSNAALDPDGQVFPWPIGRPLVGATVYHERQLWHVAGRAVSYDTHAADALFSVTTLLLVGCGHAEQLRVDPSATRPVLWTQDDEDELQTAVTAIAVSCADVDQFHDGELARPRADAFRDHLAGCARCSARLNSLMQETMAASMAASVDSAHAFDASDEPGYEHTCCVPGCGALEHDEEHTGGEGIAPAASVEAPK